MVDPQCPPRHICLREQMYLICWESPVQFLTCFLGMTVSFVIIAPNLIFIFSLSFLVLSAGFCVQRHCSDPNFLFGLQQMQRILFLFFICEGNFLHESVEQLGHESED